MECVEFQIYALFSVQGQVYLKGHLLQDSEAHSVVIE